MKISALTAATTPLSGAELFPIVQSGNTRRVSLNDLLRSIGNGTAAAPALAPGGDPNTGIYFPAADTLAFVTGGTEDWRINSGGHFLAATDASFDIGASGANRPRDLFLGRNAAIGGDAYVGIAYAGASGLSISPAGNLSFAETVGSSYVNIFRQSNSAGTVVANGYKYTNTANGFASSLNALWARSAIRLSAGGIQFYADPASTVANGTDITPTLRASIDSAGNLGLGVTPNAGWAVGKVLQIGSATGAFHYGAGGQLISGVNAYYDTDWRYASANQATYYQQSTGRHQWYTAPSGTAGATISFTQAMTLDASGRLALGTATAASTSMLTVQSLAAISGVAFTNSSGASAGTIGPYASGAGAGSTDLLLASPGFISLASGGAERWRINSSGHLVAFADATYDIGANGATRPRDLFLGRNMVGGGWVRAGAASAGAASTTTIGGTTATTVGAAGAASALPANPLGYIVAHVGTTEVRIPYYNA